MKYYLGLDNGGTSTKAALFTKDGTQLAVESIATAALTPAPDTISIQRILPALVCAVTERGSIYGEKTGSRPATASSPPTTVHGRSLRTGRQTVRKKGLFPCPASILWRANLSLYSLTFAIMRRKY